MRLAVDNVNRVKEAQRSQQDIHREKLDAPERPPACSQLPANRLP